MVDLDHVYPYRPTQGGEKEKEGGERHQSWSIPGLTSGQVWRNTANFREEPMMSWDVHNNQYPQWASDCCSSNWCLFDYQLLVSLASRNWELLLTEAGEMTDWWFIEMGVITSIGTLPSTWRGSSKTTATKAPAVCGSRGIQVIKVW